MSASTSGSLDRQSVSTLPRPVSSDPGAIDELYIRHKPNGVRYARRRGPRTPEGLFDHVFTNVIAKVDTLDEQSQDAFSSYLYRSISNRVITEQRKQRPRLMGFDDRVHQADGVTDAFDDAVVRKDWVRGLLTHLTHAERDVVFSRFLEDRTSAETAQLLGKSPEAVRQLQRSALRRLRFVLAMVVALVVGIAAVAVIQAAMSDRVPTAPAETFDEEQTAPFQPELPFVGGQMEQDDDGTSGQQVIGDEFAGDDLSDRLVGDPAGATGGSGDDGQTGAVTSGRPRPRTATTSQGGETTTSAPALTTTSTEVLVTTSTKPAVSSTTVLATTTSAAPPLPTTTTVAQTTTHPVTTAPTTTLSTPATPPPETTIPPSSTTTTTIDEEESPNTVVNNDENNDAALALINQLFDIICPSRNPDGSCAV